MTVDEIMSQPWISQWQMNGQHCGHNLRVADGTLIAKVYEISLLDQIVAQHNAEVFSNGQVGSCKE